MDGTAGREMEGAKKTQQMSLTCIGGNHSYFSFLIDIVSLINFNIANLNIKSVITQTF